MRLEVGLVTFCGITDGLLGNAASSRSLLGVCGTGFSVMPYRGLPFVRSRMYVQPVWPYWRDRVPQACRLLDVEEHDGLGAS